MKKQDLENLYQLTGEIQDIERQLKKLKPKRTDIVGDTVRDYRSGQGVPITIHGYPERAYKRRLKLTKSYNTKQEKIIKQKMSLEEELERVEEVVIRRIIRLRYFERLSWEDVAVAVDGTKSGDAMRKRLDKFLELN